MRNCMDDDHEFISALESLPAYLRTIKSGRTQFVNGITYLQTRLDTLKKFKGRTELYSPEVFDYYNPFSEIRNYNRKLCCPGQFKVLAKVQISKREIRIVYMIRTPMLFLEELYHQTYNQQMDDEDREWMAADEIDFEPLSSMLKKDRE